MTPKFGRGELVQIADVNTVPPKMVGILGTVEDRRQRLSLTWSYMIRTESDKICGPYEEDELEIPEDGRMFGDE